MSAWWSRWQGRMFWHVNQRPDGSWLFFLVEWAGPTSCQSKKKTLKKCFSLNLFAVMWSRTLTDSPITPPSPHLHQHHHLLPLPFFPLRLSIIGALLRFNAALAARTQSGHVLLLNGFFISALLSRMSRLSVMRLHVASGIHNKYPVLALISISAKYKHFHR